MKHLLTLGAAYLIAVPLTALATIGDDTGTTVTHLAITATLFGLYRLAQVGAES